MEHLHCKPTFLNISAQKREKILSVATREFSENGFENTNINLIAKKAGVSVGSLYKYFDTKRELFLTVVQAGIRQLEQTLEFVYQSDEPILAKLESVIRSIQRTSRDSELIRLYGGISAQENADLAYMAFDLAEKYRHPVIVGSDAAIGQMVEPVELPEMHEHNIDQYDWVIRGRKKGEAKREIANVYYSIGADEYMTYLRDKYAKIEAEEQRWESVQTEDAEIVLVAYGISSRVSKEAVKMARREGIKLGLIRPITLWPYPKKAFDALGEQVKAYLVVEMSILGQMVDDVVLATGNRRPVESYGEFANVPDSKVILERVREMLKKY